MGEYAVRNTCVSLLLRFLVCFLGIIFVSAVPSLFANGFHLNWPTYWRALTQIVHSLSHAPDMVYTKNEVTRTLAYNVFPEYWGYYGYSFTIFISALVASFVVGLLLTYATVMQSKKTVNVIVSILSFLESIPDLLIIAVFDFVVIAIYNQTGVLLFNVAGAFERTYFVPIVILTILPSILFFRILLLAVLEEENELYVDLARAKGLKRSRIVLVHVYRNALITLCTHLKPIFSVLLSNLVIVEYVFNIFGITRYILDHPQPDIFALSILLFFIPVYFLMAGLRLYAEHLTGKKVAV